MQLKTAPNGFSLAQISLIQRTRAKMQSELNFLFLHTDLRSVWRYGSL